MGSSGICPSIMVMALTYLLQIYLSKIYLSTILSQERTFTTRILYPHLFLNIHTPSKVTTIDRQIDLRDLYKSSQLYWTTQISTPSHPRLVIQVKLEIQVTLVIQVIIPNQFYLTATYIEQTELASNRVVQLKAYNINQYQNEKKP